MTNTKSSDNFKMFEEENENIQTLYCNIMQGFEGIGVAMASEQMVDGYYQMLNAPGYEVMGVGEIVAQCK